MTFRFQHMAAVLALSLPLGAANAQDTPDGWTSTCQTDSCTMTLSLVEAATDRKVATLLAIANKDSDELGFGVALPLGTAIGAGVLLIVGDTSISIPFQVCFPDGCRAITSLTEDQKNAISSASSAELRFFPYRSDKPVSLTTELAGFADVLENARATLSQN